MFCLETFILDHWEKTGTENQQLFDVIIDVTLFDRVSRRTRLKLHLPHFPNVSLHLQTAFQVVNKEEPGSCLPLRKL